MSGERGQPSLDKVFSWRALIALVTIFAFSVAIAQFNISILIPPITDDLGLSATDAGFLMSAFIIPYVALQVPFGLLADRMNGLYIIIFSGVTITLFCILNGFSNSYEMALISRFGVGIGASPLFPVCAGLIARYLPLSRASIAFGFLGLGLPLGSIAAMVGLPPLVAGGDWQLGFFATAPSAIILAISALVMLRLFSAISPERAKLSDVKKHIFRLVRMDGFWALVALNFTVGALHIGFLTWMPSFLMDDYGFGLEAAGVLAAVFIFLGAISSPVGGLIASRYGRKRMVLLTSSLILFLVLGIVAGLHLYLTLAMMFGLGWFLYFHFGAYFSLANELIGGRHVSVSLGLFNCIGITGAMFPPVLTGVLLDSTGSYQAGFLPLFVIAVIGIIGALLVWRLKQK